MTEQQNITFETQHPKMKNIEWRNLCELDPQEILTGLAMKTHEPTGGINSPAQIYGGIRLKVKNQETGETREIEESWRMFGKMAESQRSEQEFRGCRIVGMHGYKQMNMQITHFGLIVIPE